MLANTVVRAARLRASRSASSRMASSLGAAKTHNLESSTAMKRPRHAILSITQQQLDEDRQFRSFSTNHESLPKVATTGPIASHRAPIPTERDIAMAGGVFSLTSAKRDKLGELKNALSEEHDTLDDVATEEEVLDLHLADGIKLVTKTTDAGSDAAENVKVLTELSEWVNGQQQSGENNDIEKTSLGIKLEAVSAKLDSLLETVPSDRCLRNIRDFLDPEDLKEILEDYKGKDNPLDSDNDADANALGLETARFWDSVTRYRLLLAKSAVDHIMESWDTFTTVSDADIDRAAAEGISLESKLETVALDKVLAFLQTTISGSCSDRVTAVWNLIDRDQDGSLDQDEMHNVVHFCLAVEVDALSKLFEESLDAFPVRAPLSTMSSEDNAAPKKGWRQRRAETKIKKRLSKMFQKSCQKHFDVEVEINHRLRCIYAWANKVDQDNQVKSVMVGEQAGWSGRQRYVELSPKISEAEFREVQKIHFKHMDMLGGEIVKSFREDLWVLQGKRRERKDLIRNSFLFLAGVSAVDFAILML